jgi:hypothetical protein
VISKQELMALAAELQLQAHVVEKDYALGTTSSIAWVEGLLIRLFQGSMAKQVAATRPGCSDRPRASSESSVADGVSLHRRQAIMRGMSGQHSHSAALFGWRWRKPST